MLLIKKLLKNKMKSIFDQEETKPIQEELIHNSKGLSKLIEDYGKYVVIVFGIIFCLFLLFGILLKDKQDREQMRLAEENEKRQMEKKKLFNVIELFGKNSEFIDKKFGKPFFISEKLKNYPDVKSTYHWYKIKSDAGIKEFSVFFDRDKKNDSASIFTFILDDKRGETMIDTALRFNIDLRNEKSLTSVKNRRGDRELGLLIETYKLNINGKRITVATFDDIEKKTHSQDTLKIAEGWDD